MYFLRESIFIIAGVESAQQLSEEGHGTEREIPMQQTLQKSWIAEIYTKSKIPKVIEDIRKSRQNILRI